MPRAATPTIVLVHGAWHGGWCWSGVQHHLDRLGIASYAIDLPGRGTSATVPDGLTGDVSALSDAIDRLGRPVSLVGHSYGGAVVGDVAGRHDAVTSAVFVAAFALRTGESVNGFLRAAPRHRVRIGEYIVARPDGSSVLDPSRVVELFADLRPDTPLDPQVAAHVARLEPQPADTFTVAVTGEPFGVVPTAYLLCEDDDVVHPEHQAILADRCDRTIRLTGDHFPMLRQPEQLAAAIAAAVAVNRWRPG